MRLIKGDCHKVLYELAYVGLVVDCIIADPPYGITDNHWDVGLDWRVLWPVLNRLIKPTGSIILTSAQPLTSKLKESNMCNFSHVIHWVKPDISNPITTHIRDIEHILIFNNALLNTPKRVRFNTVENKHHPTQKPVRLMEFLLKNATGVNDTVLDFTIGSGSTGVACRSLDRDFIGVEKDEVIFKTAVETLKVS